VWGCARGAGWWRVGPVGPGPAYMWPGGKGMRAGNIEGGCLQINALLTL